MSLIAEIAYEVVAERFTPFDGAPGACLKTVREIVQHALDMDYDTFYGLYRTHTVEDNDTGIPWARDVQLSLRLGGYGVRFEHRRAGDIICTWQLARQGHIGVLYDRRLVIENTGSQRGLLISGFNRLSPLEDIPATEWEVFRLER